MATRPELAVFFFCLLISAVVSSSCGHGHKPCPRTPCQELVFYFHTIFGDYKNATSTTVALPLSTNNTRVNLPFYFGKVVAFDDPITLDSNLQSRAVGRAQGMYVGDGKSDYHYWFAFTFLFNSREHQGTLCFAGQETANKTRDISVIGGTGDFFMARGIATLSTDELELNVYLRLRVDIKLYECW